MKNLLIVILLLFLTGSVFSQTGSKRDYVGSNRGGSLVDTIKTGDSLKYININNTSTDNYLHFKNVSGSTADTFKVSNKVYGKNSTFLDRVRIGGENVWTGAIDTILIVPTGGSRSWLLKDRLIGILEIERTSNSGANYQSTNADVFFIRSGTLNR